MNLRNGICSVLLTVCISAIASAQTNTIDRLYLAFNVSAGGAISKTNDYATRSCGLMVGVRFHQRLATFITETADLNLTKTTDARKYDETLTLGAGVSYTFPVGKVFSIEPVLSCSSTIIKTDLSYLTPKLEVRGCCQIPNKSAFYIGLGMQYLHPYSKQVATNMLMAYLTLGFKLF